MTINESAKIREIKSKIYKKELWTAVELGVIHLKNIDGMSYDVLKRNYERMTVLMSDYHWDVNALHNLVVA